MGNVRNGKLIRSNKRSYPLLATKKMADGSIVIWSHLLSQPLRLLGMEIVSELALAATSDGEETWSSLGSAESTCCLRDNWPVHWFSALPLEPKTVASISLPAWLDTFCCSFSQLLIMQIKQKYIKDKTYRRHIISHNCQHLMINLLSSSLLHRRIRYRTQMLALTQE